MIAHIRRTATFGVIVLQLLAIAYVLGISFGDLVEELHRGVGGTDKDPDGTEAASGR